MWARDGCFAAMIMDGTGYKEEAELYLKWMATAQLRSGILNHNFSLKPVSDGGFHTCYDWFNGQPVGFVEPQFDNAGAFLVNIYIRFIG